MTKALYTYADYCALPDDGRRYELHAGELVVAPAPGIRHQRVHRNLAMLLWNHIRRHGLGEMLSAPTDCILDDLTVVQPDILFVATAQLSRLSERAVEGAPTLVVEVISPSSERIDRRTKLDLYARHGTTYCWLVDPVARTIDAYTLTGGEYRRAGRLVGDDPVALAPFAGLLLEPDAIWA